MPVEAFEGVHYRTKICQFVPVRVVEQSATMMPLLHKSFKWPLAYKKFKFMSLQTRP
jgi:hypothetical protein